MKDYTAANIRNIGVFGHGGEGKTTLTLSLIHISEPTRPY